MPNFTLLDLNTLLRTIGRGVVFYAPGAGDGVEGWAPGLGDPLALVHLGDTEGDITVATNSETGGLSLPEVTGPARHTATFQGENPVVTFPMFVADPDLLDILSPTGSRHGGSSFRRRAKEYTLVIFPEELFLEPQNDGTFLRRTVAFTGGVWLFNGTPMPAERQALLDLSIWFWRGYFEKTQRRFIGAPDGKNVETVTFQVLHHADMPEGHHLYTMGDPDAEAIDLEGGS